MPRVQADNYDTKRNLIMNKAAVLFAEYGYPSARMVDLAKSCGQSKSMLYHYFPKKEDLLYAILFEHLEEILASIKQLINNHQKQHGSATKLLKQFTDLFVQRSSKARSRHLIALLDVKHLPPKQQATIKDLERDIVHAVSIILEQVSPGKAASEYQIDALLLIGTINSMDIWRKPNGKYSAQIMADKISNLFLHGLVNTA